METTTMMNKTVKVFTAFSGIDAQCQALDRLVKKHNFSYELVGWSEIDKYACMAHDLIYPQWKDRNYGDVTKIDWSKVPDFDLLTWSSPCQSISVAGLRAGMTKGTGTTSSLIWSIEGCLNVKTPKYIVVENVKTLVSGKNKADWESWLGMLTNYGYKHFIQVRNAVDDGVPQHRERAFCVLIHDDGDNPYYEFPPKFKCTESLIDRLDPKPIPEKYWLSEKAVQYFQRVDADKTHNHNFNPKKDDDIAFTVRCKAGSRVDDTFYIDKDHDPQS